MRPAVLDRIWPVLLLLCALGAGLILTPVSTRALALFGFTLPGLCLFKFITGLPCPFCGLSRSFVNLVHGNWHASLASHPLGPFFFFLFAWYCVYRLLNGKDPDHLNSWILAVLAVFLVVWIFLILVLERIIR